MEKRYGLLLVLGVSILLAACSKETISPELYGSIEGRVLSGNTGKGIGGVNITTSPATTSIITNPDGRFLLGEVATGTYTINAEKAGYSSKSVSVKVREKKTTSAQLYLTKAGSSAQKYLSAEVTSWNARTNNDSTFAEVQFRVKNTSVQTDIATYEVYFEIFTNGPEFYHEMRDTSLAAGEQNIENFEKFVRNNQVDSVTISGTYTSD